MLHGRVTAAPASSACSFAGLEHLSWRERSVADLVYERGLVTAAEIESELGHTLKNATIRSMLNRLVGKGILNRQDCGFRRTFIYGPAITDASAKDALLQQFACDFFDGSVERLAQALAAHLGESNRRGKTIWLRQHSPERTGTACR